MRGPELSGDEREAQPGAWRRAGLGDAVGLDLLRGVAALVVLVVHARAATFGSYGELPLAQQNAVAWILFAVTRVGQEAVVAFFVLSGYLVGGRLLGDLGHGVFRPSAYALDRVTRIGIPLIPAVLLTVVLGAIAGGFVPPVSEIAGNMVGLNGVLVANLGWNAPLWSIAYEIWFYVLGGGIAAVIATKGRTRLAGLFLAIVAVACLLALGPLYLAFWCFGALARNLGGRSRHALLLPGGALLTVVGISLFQLGFNSDSVANVTIVSPEVALSMIALGVAAMLPGLSSPRTSEVLRLAARPIRFVAAFSFSLYLVHMPVLQAINTFVPEHHGLDVAGLLLFLLRIGASIGAAILFYLAFERWTPIVRRILKARMAAEPKGSWRPVDAAHERGPRSRIQP